jgi:hypothetical protein
MGLSEFGVCLDLEKEVGRRLRRGKDRWVTGDRYWVFPLVHNEVWQWARRVSPVSGKMVHVVDLKGRWSVLVSNNRGVGLWISGTGRVLAQVGSGGGRVGPDKGVREPRSFKFGR